jgi:hypothetical protein
MAAAALLDTLKSSSIPTSLKSQLATTAVFPMYGNQAVVIFLEHI